MSNQWGGGQGNGQGDGSRAPQQQAWPGQQQQPQQQAWPGQQQQPQQQAWPGQQQQPQQQAWQGQQQQPQQQAWQGQQPQAQQQAWQGQQQQPQQQAWQGQQQAVQGQPPQAWPAQVQSQPQQWQAAPTPGQPLAPQAQQPWQGPQAAPAQGWQGTDFPSPPAEAPLFVGGLREAILEGSGYLKPRSDGLFYVGICVACVVGVFLVALFTNTVFIYPAVIGPVWGVPGLFMVATGQPTARPLGVPSPLWVRGGLAISALLGIAAGLGTLAFYFG